ncbi:MAG: 50S ribosomal protein L30 [Clostridia bacterium]|nr:50S ribosomal protein L30 [Oscillospiraceae bacterium]MBR4867026.1 50S ribosomal protein L30 [Clostridia bacterium]MBR6762355.1 50S ribosomal protein L30 [Clostridia bacterium]
MIKVTLVKSLNGRHDKHIATAHALGLKRINDTTVQPDNDMTKGKIAQISYLVKTEIVD